MKKIDSADEMTLWLAKSKEGERAEYYRGYLLGDKQTVLADRNKIKIADMAWNAYEQSRATLMQKRNGEFDYSYIIESFGLGGKLMVMK
jgi:imidazoleglycerol phosphate synthase glutamine amidotransferase subunit HisH